MGLDSGLRCLTLHNYSDSIITSQMSKAVKAYSIHTYFCLFKFKVQMAIGILSIMVDGDNSGQEQRIT